MDYILLQMQKSEKPLSLQDLQIPLRLKNKPLIAPGIWNGYYISPDLIKKAYETTDWSAKEIRSLYLDHRDTNASDWVGEVDPKSIKFDPETGMLTGDLLIVDLNTALKLAYGAKFGISPSLAVVHDNHVVKDFKFRNFAIVVEPAMTTNYINNSKIRGGENMEEKIVEILENLANEIKSLKSEFSNFKKEYESQFEVTPEELIELAKLPSFSEFFKEYKKKYPEATMEEAAKAYKKLKSKYPEAEVESKKKKKEEYPYPETYPYPEPKKKKKKKDFSDEKPETDENEKVEPEQEQPEQPESKNDNAQTENIKENDETQKEPEQKEDNSESSDNSEPSENEPKEAKESNNVQNDIVNELKEKINLLEQKLKEFEKPVVDSPVASQDEVKQVTKDPTELFYEFVEKLKKGG